MVETGKIYNLGTTRTNKGLRLKYEHMLNIFLEKISTCVFFVDMEITNVYFDLNMSQITKYQILNFNDGEKQ